jgi:hypothetical protein
MRGLRALVWLVAWAVLGPAVAQAQQSGGDAWPDQGPPQPSSGPTPAPPPNADVWPDSPPPGAPGQAPEMGWQPGAAAPPQEPEAPAGPPPTWWFGAYGQANIVPSFLLGLFWEDAKTFVTPAFGLTATHRSESGFSIVMGLGFSSYYFSGPARNSGDLPEDTEYLNSNLGLISLRGQLLWSTDISRTLSFEYGVGLDLGVLIGQLKRTEAFLGNVGNFEKCFGPGMPATRSPGGEPYCEAPIKLPSDAYDKDGAHYGVVEKRVPPIALVPMIPALALRWTPARNIAVKLDVSFGLLQFAAGLSAAYGVDL